MAFSRAAQNVGIMYHAGAISLKQREEISQKHHNDVPKFSKYIGLKCAVKAINITKNLHKLTKRGKSSLKLVEYLVCIWSVFAKLNRDGFS